MFNPQECRLIGSYVEYLNATFEYDYNLLGNPNKREKINGFPLDFASYSRIESNRIEAGKYHGLDEVLPAGYSNKFEPNPNGEADTKSGTMRKIQQTNSDEP